MLLPACLLAASRSKVGVTVNWEEPDLKQLNTQPHQCLMQWVRSYFVDQDLGSVSPLLADQKAATAEAVVFQQGLSPFSLASKQSMPLMHKCSLAAASVTARCSAVMPLALPTCPSVLLLCRGLVHVSLALAAVAPWQSQPHELSFALVAIEKRSWHFSSSPTAMHQHLMHCRLGE